MRAANAALRWCTDIGKATRAGPMVWRDLAWAAVELALARRVLARASMAELTAPLWLDRPGKPGAAQSVIDRVSFAVTRMGPRVPWRADCLVQALAARRWLARRGIASALHIGVRNDAAFAAHAWLTVGDALVTGGEIAGYVAVIAPE